MKFPKIKSIIPLRLEWYHPGGAVGTIREPVIIKPISPEQLEELAREMRERGPSLQTLEEAAKAYKIFSKAAFKLGRAAAIEANPALAKEIKDIRIWQLMHEPKKQRMKRRKG